MYSHSFHLHFLSLVACRNEATILVEPLPRYQGSLLIVDDGGVIAAVRDPLGHAARRIGLRTPPADYLTEIVSANPFARALIIDGAMHIGRQVTPAAVVEPPEIPWMRWRELAESPPFLSAGVGIEPNVLRRISRIADRLASPVRIGASRDVPGVLFARFSCADTFVAFPAPQTVTVGEKVVAFRRVHA